MIFNRAIIKLLGTFPYVGALLTSLRLWSSKLCESHSGARNEWSEIGVQIVPPMMQKHPDSSSPFPNLRGSVPTSCSSLLPVKVNALQCSQLFALLPGWIDPLSKFCNIEILAFHSFFFFELARLYSLNGSTKCLDHTVPGTWSLQWTGCLDLARLWMIKWINQWIYRKKNMFKLFLRCKAMLQRENIALWHLVAAEGPAR